MITAMQGLDGQRRMGDRVVDRLVAAPDILGRVTDSVETALGLAGGVVQVNFVDEEGDDAWQSFSEKLACPNGHFEGDNCRAFGK